MLVYVLQGETAITTLINNTFMCILENFIAWGS